MNANQQGSHLEFTLDYSLPSNGRAAEWLLISKILIAGSHQHTYSLAIEEQQNGC